MQQQQKQKQWSPFTNPLTLHYCDYCDIPPLLFTQCGICQYQLMAIRDQNKFKKWASAITIQQQNQNIDQCFQNHKFTRMGAQIGSGQHDVMNDLMRAYKCYTSGQKCEKYLYIASNRADFLHSVFGKKEGANRWGIDFMALTSTGCIKTSIVSKWEAENYLLNMTDQIVDIQQISQEQIDFVKKMIEKRELGELYVNCDGTYPSQQEVEAESKKYHENGCKLSIPLLNKFHICRTIKDHCFMCRFNQLVERDRQKLFDAMLQPILTKEQHDQQQEYQRLQKNHSFSEMIFFCQHVYKKSGCTHNRNFCACFWQNQWIDNFLERENYINQQYQESMQIMGLDKDDHFGYMLHCEDFDIPDSEEGAPPVWNFESEYYKQLRDKEAGGKTDLPDLPTTKKTKKN